MNQANPCTLTLPSFLSHRTTSTPNWFPRRMVIRKLCRRAKVRHVCTAVVVTTIHDFNEFILILIGSCGEEICYPYGEEAMTSLTPLSSLQILDPPLGNTQFIYKTLQNLLYSKGKKQGIHQRFFIEQKLSETPSERYH